MAPASLQLQRVERSAYSIGLYVPDPEQIQEAYRRQQQLEPNTPFPHWSRLWPAGLALADFIAGNPDLIRNKRVLELAAGLGLPGFIAARHAKQVIVSDYLEQAVEVMKKNVVHLGLANVSCSLLDWNKLPDDLTADILLLSDINYDPTQFDRLYLVLQRFVKTGATIILSTPQRLMAKSFIERLLPFCFGQYELPVEHQLASTQISVLILTEQTANR